MAIGKLAPIKKAHGDSVNTLDQQLSKNGYQRFPGTTETFQPAMEPSGKYRTGLDSEAPYLDRLAPEDKEREIKRIISDKVRLEEAFGVRGLLDPTSKFWNVYASRESLIKKFGSDLKANVVKLGNSEEFFDTSDINKEIAWNWIRVHPRIAPSLEAYRKGKASPDAKYYVVDDEAETRDSYNKKRVINKAIVEFESLSPTKKKQIARLMGLPVTESTKEETVYNLIDDQLKESEFRSGDNKGISPVRLFTELLETTDLRLKVKDLISQALTHSVYRKGQGGKILEGGVTIATSQEELTEHLLDEKNQIDLIALEKKLTGKKIEKL